MKINIKNSCHCLVVIAISISIISCNDFLDRKPISNITPQQYFNNADELAAYTINYYESLINTPQGNWNAGPVDWDASTDNMVVGNANTNLFAKNKWLVPSGTNVGVNQNHLGNRLEPYNRIRSMNYFFSQVLPKYEAGTINGSETDINQYIGEAYFLRAAAYYESLVRFGDFPIVTEVLADEPTALIEASKRAPRNEVARFILSDLDKAVSMLKSGITYNKVRIGREVALLFKSRVALFEATFETYHKGTPRIPGEAGWPGASKSYNSGKTFNIDAEISFFLTEAMNAAEEVADGHSLTENSQVVNPNDKQMYGWNPYFEMFSMPDPSKIDEVLMWRDYSAELNLTHGTLSYIRLGGNNGMTKSFVDAYLMGNGLPIYAPNAGYAGDVSIDTQKSKRDNRLQLFVFGESTPLENRDTLILFGAPSVIGLAEHRDRTGFRVRKHFVYDYDQNNGGMNSTNGFVVYRVAEAYLNYMEASYLKNGTVNGKAASYWRAIRARAGVDPDFNKTIAATDLSKEPDWAVYSGSTKVDPTLYNIRRERRCEFVGEGFRFSDLLRWRSFDALFEGNMGAYIPEGVNFWTEMYKNRRYMKVDSNNNPTTETALIEQKDGLSTANISNRSDSKYLRPDRIIKENNEVFNGYQWTKAYYLHPLGSRDLTLASPDGSVENSMSYQNPYWPTTASSGALE